MPLTVCLNLERFMLLYSQCAPLSETQVWSDHSFFQAAFCGGFRSDCIPLPLHISTVNATNESNRPTTITNIAGAI
jgi:hypothetical protein